MLDSFTQMLTPHARKAVFEYTQRHAIKMQHNTIDTGHLLLGILSKDPAVPDSSNVAERMHNALEISLYQVRTVVESIEHTTTRFSGDRPFDPSVEVVLNKAARLATIDPLSYVNHVTRFHIAQALGQVADPMFLQILKELGVDPERYLFVMEGKVSLVG